MAHNMATIKRLHKNFRWLDLEVASFQRNVIRRSLVKHLNIFSRSIPCNDPILKFIEILTNRLFNLHGKSAVGNEASSKDVLFFM